MADEEDDGFGSFDDGFGSFEDGGGGGGGHDDGGGGAEGTGASIENEPSGEDQPDQQPKTETKASDGGADLSAADPITLPSENTPKQEDNGGGGTGDVGGDTEISSPPPAAAGQPAPNDGATENEKGDQTMLMAPVVAAPATTMAALPPLTGTNNSNDNGVEDDDDDPFASLGGPGSAPPPILGTSGSEEVDSTAAADGFGGDLLGPRSTMTAADTATVPPAKTDGIGPSAKADVGGEDGGDDAIIAPAPDTKSQNDDDDDDLLGVFTAAGSTSSEAPPSDGDAAAAAAAAAAVAVSSEEQVVADAQADDEIETAPAAAAAAAAEPADPFQPPEATVAATTSSATATATSTASSFDHLSSFVSAAESECVIIDESLDDKEDVAAESKLLDDGDDNDDDDDDDDFGGFEDAASEDKEEVPPTTPMSMLTEADADADDANKKEEEDADDADDDNDAFGGFDDAVAPSSSGDAVTEPAPIVEDTNGVESNLLGDYFGSFEAPTAAGGGGDAAATPALVVEDDADAGKAQDGSEGDADQLGDVEKPDGNVGSDNDLTKVDAVMNGNHGGETALEAYEETPVVPDTTGDLLSPESVPVAEAAPDSAEDGAFGSFGNANDVVAPVDIAEPEPKASPVESSDIVAEGIEETVVEANDQSLLDTDTNIEGALAADEQPEAPQPVPETDEAADDSFGDFGASSVEPALAVDEPAAPEPAPEADEAAEHSFGDFGASPLEQTSTSDDAPLNKDKASTEDVGDDDDFDAFTEAPSQVEPAVIPGQPVAEAAAGEDQSRAPHVTEKEDDSDDDDFGDFGAFEEADESPKTEEQEPEPAGTVAAAETSDFGAFDNADSGEQQKELTPAQENGNDDDDDDDDFGDFGDFNAFEEAAPAPAPVAAPKPAASGAGAATEQGFAASFEDEVAPPTPQMSTDPVIEKASIVFKGIFSQYARDTADDQKDADAALPSVPIKSILDSVLAFESDTDVQPVSSSKEKLNDILSKTETERSPSTLIMNYDMPKPYAHYSAASGQGLKTDRGLSLEASSHPSNGDVFVPEVLSIDLPKEAEFSPVARSSKPVVNKQASEFVDFPTMSDTRVEIPYKKEEDTKNKSGFANSEDKATAPAAASGQEPPTAVDKFLAKIPDLSFMLKSELALPTK